jgi:hypothetical protein
VEGADEEGGVRVGVMMVLFVVVGGGGMAPLHRWKKVGRFLDCSFIVTRSKRTNHPWVELERGERACYPKLRLIGWLSSPTREGQPPAFFFF